MKKSLMAVVLALVLAACLVGCGGSGSPSSSGAAVSQAAQLEDRNGFDEATNSQFTAAGVAFSVPAYYGEPSTNDNGAVFYKIDESAGLVYRNNSTSNLASSFSDDLKKNLSNNLLEQFDSGARIVGAKETTVAGKAGYLIRAEGKKKGTSVLMEDLVILDPAIDTWGLIRFMQFAGGKFDYLPDFNRVIGSAVAVEQPVAEAPAAEQPAAAESGEVTPDLKASLDSYEAFVDEYIAFMEKYKQNSSDMSLLAEYASFMQKYTDFVKKIDALDTNNMSSADLAYYLEVTGRVSQKMLNAAL